MKKLYLFILFIAFSLVSFSQKKLGITEYTTNTTIGIRANGTQTINGTGLFFTFQTTKGAVPSVITSRRLLEDAQSITFFFLESNFAGMPQYGRMQEITLNKPDLVVFNHPDKDVDLSLIPLTGVLTHFINKKITISFHPITENVIARDSLSKTLNPVETVYLVGYPSGSRKELGGTPFVKRGITATPLFADYNQRKEFLIDIPFYDGQLGAPVYIYQNGNVDRNDQRMDGQRILLAGISTSSFTEAGATVAVKASRILEFKKLLEETRQQ